MALFFVLKDYFLKLEKQCVSFFKREFIRLRKYAQTCYVISVYGMV